MTAERERPSFTRLLVALAAATIVLGGMRAAASVVTIVIMAFFFGILLMPFYQGMVRRTGRSAVAMTATAAVVVVVGGSLAWLLLYSAGRLVAQLGTYADDIALRMQETSGGVVGPAGEALKQVLSQIDPQVLVGFLGSVAMSLVSAVANAGVAVFVMLFFLAEAPVMIDRLRVHLGDDHPVLGRFERYGHDMFTYFAVRTRLNLVTGVGVALLLWVLGVDFPILWGVLTFFLSYIPYIGLILATIPGTVLAFAEFGLGRALLVVLAIVVWNLVIENIMQPSMTGKELQLSPTFVFVMFLFWAWLFGPIGSFLAMPITVALVLAMDSFDDARWVAGLFGIPLRLPPERASVAAVAPADEME